MQRLVVMAAVCGGTFAAWGCGDSSNSSTGANATPVTVATPTPVPPPVATEPAHTPEPPPCSSCEAPVTNTNPPVRLTIRVYKVEDLDGKIVAGIPTSIPVGYKVTIDATPKDIGNRDTLGSGTVDFSFSNESLVRVSGNHGFQKKMTVLRAGTIQVQAFLDGVESNVLEVTLGD